tara:strand:+ start:334 stop:789 length:456 start_codon:yes stop_codon:yes gene_type:complete
MPPKKNEPKKNDNDSSSDEELNKLANMTINDDELMNHTLFREQYKEITPIKRATSSPMSPLSSGDNTPRSFTSMDSVGSLSGLSEKALAPNKKMKKEPSFELCQECKPGSMLFHPGRPSKIDKKKKLNKKKGGKTKKRKTKRKKTRRKYKR